RIVLAELPRLEPEHSSARVREREQEATREVVVPASVDESRCDELLAREPAIHRLAHERRAAEGEPEPELTATVRAEPSPCEVVARDRARLRGPEVALVEGRRRVEQLVEPLAAASLHVVLRRRLLVFELDVEAVREPFDRAGELELLRVADERDQVALRAAAEAVEELVGRVD